MSPWVDDNDSNRSKGKQRASEKIVDDEENESPIENEDENLIENEEDEQGQNTRMTSPDAVGHQRQTQTSSRETTDNELQPQVEKTDSEGEEEDETNLTVSGKKSEVRLNLRTDPQRNPGWDVTPSIPCRSFGLMGWGWGECQGNNPTSN